MATTWELVVSDLKAALDAFVRGDATAYKELWSRDADISLMGAFGGVVTGQDAVRQRLDRAAAMYRHGTYERFEVVAQGTSPELAYVVWLETITSVDGAGGVVTRSRRATQVFRLERSGWRIVHQHSDPLVTPDAAVT